jgi:drug/metabolite transporter (DMT)-like permease
LGVDVLTELSLILAADFWGTNYAATKYAAEHLPELPIVALRFTVGGLLLLLLVLRLLEPELGCLGVATAFAAWQGGISRIGAKYLITLTGVASGVVFFDESLGASKLLGLYLARRQ